MGRHAAYLFILGALLLAACGNNEARRDLLMADGLWGWNDGEGCDGLSDAVRIEGDRYTFYRQGDELYWTQGERKMGVPGSSGGSNPKNITWRYLTPDSEGIPHMTADLFSVHYTRGREGISHLRLERRTVAGVQVEDVRGRMIAPCPG